MEINQRTLAEAWRRTAARHTLLDGVGLPPVAQSEDELEELAESAEEAAEAGKAGAAGEDGGLCLLVEDDGTVRGRHGPYREVFATRDLDQVLYLIAEAAMRRRGGSLETVADALDLIDPTWGVRFRSGGLDDIGTVEACGRDPLEGLAWIAGSWREQAPYTNLDFFRAVPGQTVDAERLALLYGANPAQLAAGTRLKDLQAVDNGRAHGDRQWESCCFGQAGEWTYLLYHDTPPGVGVEHILDMGLRPDLQRPGACEYSRDGRP
ncbi:hypothetical protein [Streptomyces griseus]